ncbi:MAG: hypothetical protein MOGMAGMI_02451 [Candidatus Omnitrophica bacterium]|nr:hypothetical protein [Candidatus Omnitrophota bacterium]
MRRTGYIRDMPPTGLQATRQARSRRQRTRYGAVAMGAGFGFACLAAVAQSAGTVDQLVYVTCLCWLIGAALLGME